MTDYISQPIKSAYAKLYFPLLIGLIVSGLFNIVDGIFIGHKVGAQALGAVSVVFPIQMTMFALSSAVSTGLANRLGHLLGAKQTDQARSMLNAGLTLAVLVALTLTVLVLLAAEPLLGFLGANDVLMQDALAYLLPVISASLIFFISGLFSDVFRIQGKMQWMTGLIMASALLNIALDALFVLVFDWQVAGAAWATVLAQALTVLIALNLNRKAPLPLQLAFNFDLARFGSIISLGIPTFLSFVGLSLMVAAINMRLADDGDAVTLISAYSIVGRLMMFLYIPAIAAMITLQTLVSVNAGAGQMDRVMQAIGIAVRAMVFFGVAIFAVMFVFPAQLTAIFINDVATTDAAVIIMKWFSASMLAGVIIQLFVGVYQGLGKAKQATFLSCVKVYFLQLPAMLLIAPRLPVDNIWPMLLGLEWAALVIVLAVFAKQFQQLKGATV